MPFKDADAKEVGKGDKVVVSRTVSVDTASATVEIGELVSVTDVLGARVTGEGQVSTNNDEAVEIDNASADSEVTVEFYTPDGAGALTNSAPGAARDVEVVVEGY